MAAQKRIAGAARTEIERIVAKFGRDIYLDLIIF